MGPLRPGGDNIRAGGDLAVQLRGLTGVVAAHVGTSGGEDWVIVGVGALDGGLRLCVVGRPATEFLLASAFLVYDDGLTQASPSLRMCTSTRLRGQRRWWPKDRR